MANAVLALVHGNLQLTQLVGVVAVDVDVDGRIDDVHLGEKCNHFCILYNGIVHTSLGTERVLGADAQCEEGHTELLRDAFLEQLEPLLLGRAWLWHADQRGQC